MRIADNWKDYELIDCSGGERLERWGDIILIRPDPQVIWQTPKTNPLWRSANARYVRSKTGGGRWEVFRKLPERWKISYGELTFNVKTMGFKHTGIFPEQAVNWDLMQSLVKKENRPVKALNLFAYTGAATAALLRAGASTVHVDAAKGMVSWAKENAASSGLSEKPVRWIVDDCVKFVRREINRENKYDIILMDPPSYGRGPGGEIWKIEDEIYSLVKLCSEILSDSPVMFLINSYTTGLSPSSMEYILRSVIKPKKAGSFSSGEIGLPVTSTGLTLPCGASAMWIAE